jgi:hypothetical protein
VNADVTFATSGIIIDATHPIVITRKNGLWRMTRVSGMLKFFLGKLPELKFEFFRRVDALLYQQAINGVNSGLESFIAR